jgi:peptidoglycan/LPS O-acetylase OafA/YrhL
MVLSGLTLTSGAFPRYDRFLLAQLCRLWPAYALCVLLGAAAIAKLPAPSILVWYLGYDLPNIQAALTPDPPVWVVCIEAWMVPLLPVFAWLGRGTRLRGLLIPPAYLLLGRLDWHLTWAAYFMAGAWAQRFTPHWPLAGTPLAARLPQWLGKVSYSLYLSHWPLLQACLLAFGAWGLGVAALLIPGAAWMVWRFVERPSLAMSRLISGASVLTQAGASARHAPAHAGWANNVEHTVS